MQGEWPVSSVEVSDLAVSTCAAALIPARCLVRSTLPHQVLDVDKLSQTRLLVALGVVSPGGGEEDYIDDVLGLLARVDELLGQLEFVLSRGRDDKDRVDLGKSLLERCSISRRVRLDARAELFQVLCNA